MLPTIYQFFATKVSLEAIDVILHDVCEPSRTLSLRLQFLKAEINLSGEFRNDFPRGNCLIFLDYFQNLNLLHLKEILYQI